MTGGGGGGVLASDFEHHHHVVHLGLGRASWHGTQGLPPPFRRPLCPSCRVGFAPIPTKSGESRAERAGRPGPAHRGQRRLELGANSYEVLVPRSPMGACIHAPWPWPRGDQKMRERQRQTATKPTYYIRGIEITAISGLGRFGAGGPRQRLRAPSSCRPHGPRSCQMARYPRTTPAISTASLPVLARRFRADPHEVGRIEGIGPDLWKPVSSSTMTSTSRSRR